MVFGSLIVLCWLLLSSFGAAQTAASLETAETRLQFEAGLDAPKVLTLRDGTTTWKNHTAESLSPNVEIAGASVPLRWTFNHVESHTNRNVVSFVYDAPAPH